MRTKEIYLKRIFSTLIILSIIIPFVINKYFGSRYGDDIFLIQPNVVGVFFTIIVLCFLLIQYNKIINNIFSFKKKYIDISGFWLIFLISFLYKYFVFKFELYGDYTETIEDIFLGNGFNDYKLYNYIAYFIYKLTPNHNLYLFLLNNILGSLSLSFFYLILKIINKEQAINHLIIILLIMYVPLIALETMLRVDILYIFLLITSVYLIISISKNLKKSNLILFFLIMFLLTLTREQTLYFLPLYLIYILIGKFDKRYLIAVLLSLIVIIPSLMISNFNKNEYGVSSKYRDFHLIVKMSQYGYLNKAIMDSYQNELSDDAKILLSEINNAYERNIVPHKREPFVNQISSFRYLIRPDIETIRIKSFPTTTKANVNKVRAVLISELKMILQKHKRISKKEFNQKISLLTNKFQRKYDKDMMVYIKSIMIYQYMTEHDNRLGNVHACSVGDNVYETKCLIGIAKHIANKNYIKHRSENWFYTKTGLQFTLIPNSDQNGYFRHHDKIDKINEIILAVPALYVTQSLLTATSIIGHVPVPVSIGGSRNFYEGNIIPKIFIKKPFQKVYRTPMNLWYLFSFWALILPIIFMPNTKERDANLFIAILPLYYGLFISFATYAEFMRLMIPVAPFILYNFFIVITFLAKYFLNKDRI